MDDLKKYIRGVPDFPKPGILFYDITTLFQDPVGFDKALNAMQAFVQRREVQKIVGIEARGFILGGALADRLGLGFIPARKPGKLPFRTIREAYALEYGTDSLELHADGVSRGERVVIVDDLLATGGTAKATCRLVENLGGVVVGVSAVIGLTFLPFRQALAGYDVDYLISYDSE
jgi:adenine phosphoribosyltransferase